jgi:hypothetical protein
MVANNLATRGMQHDPLCPLCNAVPENMKHLLINYVFTKEDYRLIWLWFRLKGSATSCLPSQEPADWFEHHVVRSSIGDSRKVAGILLY